MLGLPLKWSSLTATTYCDFIHSFTLCDVLLPFVPHSCILLLRLRLFWLGQAVYEEEQRGYYILSSFWAELDKDQVLGEPVAVRTYDMHTCTLEDVQVISKQ